jgi:DNA-binding NtrC family response regulator
VLILGESGTGKGMLARWIHDHSLRKDGAFVDINCSGLKGELLKSELFGHARGAFTGAVGDRPGLIEEADGGTLFLDEIGDMDADAQCQLLKAVEEKVYRRLGENKLRSSDFRLICATNRNLPEAVERGAFREDLFYRVSTLIINVPPLSARKADIPELLNHILRGMGYSHFPVCGGVLDALARHTWRGNIRELRSAVERALIFARGEALTAEHFSDIGERACRALAGTPARPEEPIWNLKDLEAAHVLRAVERFGNDKSKASDALGISLASLYRKLKKVNN